MSPENEAAQEDRLNWGRKAANYYESEADSENETLPEDDSGSDLAIEEANEVERVALAALAEEDFNLDEFKFTSERKINDASANYTSDFETDKLRQIMSGSSLSKEALNLVIKRDHPELLTLLKEIVDRTQESTEKLQPILMKIKGGNLVTSKGLSYLEAKQHIILCYLQYLVFYLLLKLGGHPVADHPVVERLVEMRTLLTQLKSVDQKIQPQITRLISSKQTQSKPRLDLLEIDDEFTGDEDLIYKPPKLVPVEYSGPDPQNALKSKLEEEQSREERRLKRSVVAETLREAFQQTPLEISTNDTSLLESDVKTRKLAQQQRKREEFEEEHMIRLPTSKAEKKARRLLEQKQKTLLSEGMTLDDLDRFVDATMEDPTLGNAKQIKITESLNSVRAAAQKMEQRMQSANLADLHVAARATKRIVPVNEDFAIKDSEPISSAHEEVPQQIKDSVEKKRKRKEEFDLKKIRKVTFAEDVIEGKRGTSYQIEKNKGLIRHRKKIEGNARVHNRMKYEKKLKKLKASKPTQREDSAAGHYGGEATGIRTNLKKSISLAV